VLLDGFPAQPSPDRPVVMEMDVDECEWVSSVTVSVTVPFSRIPELAPCCLSLQEPREIPREPEHAPPRQG
jgi:hypothetical protein